jgi:hypothetical protein
MTPFKIWLPYTRRCAYCREWDILNLVYFGCTLNCKISVCVLPRLRYFKSCLFWVHSEL